MLALVLADALFSPTDDATRRKRTTYGHDDFPRARRAAYRFRRSASRGDDAAFDTHSSLRHDAHYQHSFRFDRRSRQRASIILDAS